MKSNNKGFTLIEMAIVLVIIGLILGAVTKGKDVIESAKQKKFYNTVVKGWELAIDSYADRTGLLLADTAENDNSGTRDNHFSGSVDNAIAQLKAVGLTAPTDSASIAYGGATITMAFDYTTNSRNQLSFTGVPYALLIGIDTIIDGEMNATTGSVKYEVPTTITDATVAPFTYDITTP